MVKLMEYEVCASNFCVGIGKPIVATVMVSIFFAVRYFIKRRRALPDTVDPRGPKGQ